MTAALLERISSIKSYIGPMVEFKKNSKKWETEENIC